MSEVRQQEQQEQQEWHAPPLRMASISLMLEEGSTEIWGWVLCGEMPYYVPTGDLAQAAARAELDGEYQALARKCASRACEIEALFDECVEDAAPIVGHFSKRQKALLAWSIEELMPESARKALKTDLWFNHYEVCWDCRSARATHTGLCRDCQAAHECQWGVSSRLNGEACHDAPEGG